MIGLSVSAVVLTGVCLVAGALDAKPSWWWAAGLPVGLVVGCVVMMMRWGPTTADEAARRVDRLLDSDDLVLSAFELADERSSVSDELVRRADATLAEHPKLDLPHRHRSLALASPATVVVLALVFAAVRLGEPAAPEDPSDRQAAQLVLRVSRGAQTGGAPGTAENLRELAEALREGRVAVEVVRRQLTDLAQRTEADPPPDLPPELAGALAEDLRNIAAALGDEVDLSRTELATPEAVRKIEQTLRQQRQLAALGGDGEVEPIDPDELKRLVETPPNIPEADLDGQVTRYAEGRRLTARQRGIVRRYFERMRRDEPKEDAP